jgi:hypothetical protein
MPINRAAISKELLPGLNAVFGMEYGEVNNEHEPLYEVENSDRSFEEEVLFTGFGTAPTKVLLLFMMMQEKALQLVIQTRLLL